MDLKTSLIYFTNDGIITGKSPTTLASYESNTKLLFDFLKNEFIPLQVESLTKENLERFFIHGIKIRKWSQINHWSIYLKLHAYFAWLVKKGILSNNPLAEIQKPRQPHLPPKSLSEQEAINFLKAVSGLKTNYYFTTLRNKAVMTTFLFTGLRKSELINLKNEDVDLENGFLIVQRGKGGKRREIPLEQSTLVPILQEYLDYRIKLGKDSEWFFNGTFSGRGTNNKLAVSTLDRLFSKLSKLINKRVSAHRLRHSFATILLDKTGDLYVLQQLMGHSDIATTCVYLSTSRRKKIEVINKLTLNSGEELFH